MKGRESEDDLADVFLATSRDCLQFVDGKLIDLDRLLLDACLGFVPFGAHRFAKAWDLAVKKAGWRD